MTRAEMLAVVRENLITVVDTAADLEIAEHQSLAEFGVDSLEIVEVVSRSMKQLKLRVKRTQLTDAKNIADLLDLFEAAQS